MNESNRAFVVAQSTTTFFTCSSNAFSAFYSIAITARSFYPPSAATTFVLLDVVACRSLSHERSHVAKVSSPSSLLLSRFHHHHHHYHHYPDLTLDPVPPPFVCIGPSAALVRVFLVLYIYWSYRLLIHRCSWRQEVYETCVMRSSVRTSVITVEGQLWKFQ